MGRRAVGSLIVAVGLALSAASLSAQSVKVGGQVSFSDDYDFGIGPRLQGQLGNIAQGLWIAGSFDYFFPDQGPGGGGEDFDYWEINGNLLYDIVLAGASNVAPYFGAGVNVARRTQSTEGSDGDGDTQVGLNLLAGLNFPLSGFTPFVEVKIEIEGGEQFVVTGGILFP